MAANDASKLLPKPINIRDYEMTKTIGLGSHSIVKLAKNQQNNKFFAIKKLKKTDMIKLGLVEHVKNEIKSLATSESIFIEKYQGFALDDKYIYIATELLTGGDLFSLLRKDTKFNIAQAQ
jgi:serine/threonine protein kinase